VSKDLEKTIANELLKDKFVQESGHKAIVQRDRVENERTEGLREVIVDIAKDIQTIGLVHKELTYCCSMTVHVYKAITTGQLQAVCINNLGNQPHSIVDFGMRELNGGIVESYGKKRQVRRSGL
jgi:hypothetical protein